jgi:hypothetical protein
MLFRTFRHARTSGEEPGTRQYPSVLFALQILGQNPDSHRISPPFFKEMTSQSPETLKLL